MFCSVRKGNDFSREKLHKGCTYLKEKYNWSIKRCFDEDLEKAGTHTHDNDSMHWYNLCVCARGGGVGAIISIYQKIKIYLKSFFQDSRRNRKKKDSRLKWAKLIIACVLTAF